ncbi:hypothetical protein M378DRAFT_86436 [Amanita muscaria Koide BX008]|uniref:CDP-diacylglycerol--glycerol-3-phosphate 3-phosphatidyltransferase n=1 Tax=Amanita muscaria (strain Koide BX008) TaxID=946122 RepID=A0A0C2WQK7_AMAMK|nr:hypothetical protein M378DRAFT_86436 [Amanita muscaria Koide BX008]
MRPFTVSSVRFYTRQASILPSCRRRLATLNIDPSLRDFTHALAKRQPRFLVSPRNIQFLTEPKQFYALLLDMIKRAQDRIFLSSLYIGSGELELISTIESALRRNPSLQLFMQLDLNRSTRPGPSSAAKLLLPLLRDFPSRVHVSMFRSPALSGISAKLVPPRFNEGWGTWHAKIYGVDDEVMISGANLNKSYFSDRQDRYVHITENSTLAQYCFAFLKTVSTFSYRLRPSDTRTRAEPHSITQGDYTLHWPDLDTHPHNFHDKARCNLVKLQQSYLEVPENGSASKEKQALGDAQCTSSVMLFPLIQAGQFRVHEEEDILSLLFHHLNSGQKSLSRPLLDLTTGYFGLYKPYQDLILKNTNLDTRIVCSAPKANGFFGSKGISGRIPEGYTYLEQHFMRAVHQAGREWTVDGHGRGTGVQLSEWEKDGWTYHAKGIWLSPSSESLPILTVFGSTNLNSRSAHLDTELSFLMITPSELQNAASSKEVATKESLTSEADSVTQLRQQLRSELENIREHAVDWRGGQRKVRLLTKAIVHLVKNML